MILLLGSPRLVSYEPSEGWFSGSNSGCVPADSPSADGLAQPHGQGLDGEDDGDHEDEHHGDDVELVDA
jgi:hypothetical protein